MNPKTLLAAAAVMLLATSITPARAFAQSDDPIVVGALGKEQIDRVMKQHLSRVRDCYLEELNRYPSLAGKIVVKFTIAADGSVSSANIASSSLNNKVVEGCITEVLERLRFPAPRNGGIVVVKFPFVFRSQGGATDAAAEQADSEPPQDEAELQAERRSAAAKAGLLEALGDPDEPPTAEPVEPRTFDVEAWEEGLTLRRWFDAGGPFMYVVVLTGLMGGAFLLVGVIVVAVSWRARKRIGIAAAGVTMAVSLLPAAAGLLGKMEGMGHVDAAVAMASEGEKQAMETKGRAMAAIPLDFGLAVTAVLLLPSGLLLLVAVARRPYERPSMLEPR